MEKGGKHTENRAGTSKRDRVEDEISPTTAQESKQRRMGANEESQIGEILAKLKKLDAIDAIQADIASIKTAQANFFDSINKVQSKVENLEKEVEILKSSNASESIKDDMRELRKKDAMREQSLANDTVTIRSLPLEIIDNNGMLQTVIQKIFGELKMEIFESQYEAYATKMKNSAMIVMKFSSGLLKARVVRKFREVKKKSTVEVPFLVEKIVSLPMDHHLNGTTISIVNKLTIHNAQLIQNARQYVKSHFDFVFDTPENAIMVKAEGKFHRIDDEEDLTQLIEKVESQRNSGIKVKQKQHAPSSVKTRSAAKNIQKRGLNA